MATIKKYINITILLLLLLSFLYITKYNRNVKYIMCKCIMGSTTEQARIFTLYICFIIHMLFMPTSIKVVIYKY